MRSALPLIECLVAPSNRKYRLLPSTVSLSESAQLFDYPALGSNRKLEGAAGHLIDGSEKRICRLSFEF